MNVQVTTQPDWSRFPDSFGSQCLRFAQLPSHTLNLVQPDLSLFSLIRSDASTLAVSDKEVEFLEHYN